MTTNAHSEAETKPFTDAPVLQPNLVVGSVQLLFWLFVHPSAWRNHIRRIDASLQPDFAMAELHHAQWRNPHLQRLLVQGYVAIPILIGILVSLLLLGWSDENIVIGTVLAIVITGSVGIMAGLTGSVAVGIAAGLITGLASGLIIEVAETVTDTEEIGAIIGAIGSVSVGIIGSVAASIAGQRQVYPLPRQVGGIIVGTLIGTLAFALAIAIAERMGANLAGDLAIGITGGLAVGAANGAAVGWRTQRWQRGLFAGTVGSLAFGLSLGLAVLGIGGVITAGGNRRAVRHLI